MLPRMMTKMSFHVSACINSLSCSFGMLKTIAIMLPDPAAPACLPRRSLGVGGSRRSFSEDGSLGEGGSLHSGSEFVVSLRSVSTM